MRPTEGVVVALMRERHEAKSAARRRAADLLLAATLDGEAPVDVAALAARDGLDIDGALVEEIRYLALGLGLLRVRG